MTKRGWYLLFLLLGLNSCDNGTVTEPLSDPTFIRLSCEETGICFANDLEYNEQLNAYTYRNFYNGAGVAVGDINNDGLPDLYFAGNQVNNKLFLNKGGMRFEDITMQAGVASANVWSTGVSMADVNGDGLLDIYVCKSGPLEGTNRNNELFINNGDLTFSEQAEAYGVADLGLSNHAAFMDYDKDGDLDFYLLNNSTRSVGIYDLRKGQRSIPDPEGGNKLYRNDGDRFTDVTSAAGIYSSAIGYGLGVTVADINVDGWPDIFVSNDFFERDYLYINNQDGTFAESFEQYITETSMGSMGADIADLNGDGYPEIYVTEMLPESMERVKTKTVFEDWNKYQSNVKNGYHHQFTRNSLQLNQGQVPGSEGEVFFSEVSRQKGLHATDWSWGALIFDYDNDGNKDLFVANGIYKDLTDQDYVNFYANNTQQFEKYKEDSTVVTRMIDTIPSVPLPNYLFRNSDDFTFESVAASEGLTETGFSNGSVYSDLDNDGDLDLVVNNINDEVYIYQNTTSDRTSNGYLLVELRGNDQNPFAFGTKVSVYMAGKTFTQEHNPVKGYMSSMDYRMHFGLGKFSAIDSLEVAWPDGSYSVMRGVEANRIIELDQANAPGIKREEQPANESRFGETALSLDYAHKENAFSDFDRDRLIFQMASNEGPAAAKGDVNGDGLEDLYLGGSKGTAGSLFVQTPNGSFTSEAQPVFEADALSEDLDASFADIDGDGDLDLLVASGGNEYSLGDPYLVDRVYRNNGQGSFEKLAMAEFPAAAHSSAFLKPIDYDNDGDVDLVSGTRLIPFNYGVPGGLQLFKNVGNGTFINDTKAHPYFEKLGMLTDALVVDIDQDEDQDLVLIGEWMPVTIFLNSDGAFEEATNKAGLVDSHGLWKTIESGDFNGDGLIDLAVGNIGLNTRLKASTDKPLTLHVNDYDGNGSVEQITCMYEGDRSYPIVLLQDLVKQLPSLRKKYILYDSYKDQTMEDIFTQEQLDRTLTLKAQELASCLFINQGNGRFEKQYLPAAAQISQTYAIQVTDIDNDNVSDLILGGNQTRMKPELGINNASYGLTLKGLGDGTFEPLKAIESGVFVRGEVRQILDLKVGDEVLTTFVRNNDKLVVFKKNTER